MMTLLHLSNTVIVSLELEVNTCVVGNVLLAKNRTNFYFLHIFGQKEFSPDAFNAVNH